jgi:3-dehydroquinate synthase
LTRTIDKLPGLRADTLTLSLEPHPTQGHRHVNAIRVDVTTDAARYPVHIEPGALARLGTLLDAAGFPAHRVLVSSPVVWRLHGDVLRRALPGSEPVLIPDGERAKTLQTVGRIYDALIRSRADRGAGLVAIGGGVVGDTAGFAAATYLRGIAAAQVPTTLLAQVDSAIGGKVGVNHALGKNLIGAFHQPRIVVADPLVLGTLPRREFRAGLYEIVKYGMAFDAALFGTLATETRAVVDRDTAVITPIIARSCEIKAKVVMEDERERGPRRLLNFGHTAGHAFEALTAYRRFRHGEAIAWGMLVAADLSVARGALRADDRDALASLVRALGPLPPISDLATADALEAISRDKKVVGGRLHFVIATGLGSAAVADDVSEEELRGALVRTGTRA